MFIAIESKDDCFEALEAARRYSPNIEIVDETTLVFDLTGSKAIDAPRIAAALREKFESVAVSENLAAALLVVRFQVSSSTFQVRKTDVEAKESSLSKKLETWNLKLETCQKKTYSRPKSLNTTPVL